MKRVCLTIILFFLFSSAIRAQYFTVGEEPAGTKWMQMKSPDIPEFSVIYPKTADTVLSRYMAMNYLGYLWLAKITNSCGVDYSAPFFKTYPTVIHPFNAASNGVTLWAPRQIHFYSIPPTEMSYPQYWTEQLGIHEGRHAWQMAHFNKGFWKIMSYIFGEQAIGLASGVYPSAWFMEGDAVVAETEIGNVGRGTSPSFLRGTLGSIIPETLENADEATLKKYFAYGKNRSWDRWRFGSVKYYSPNRYEVGYMINSMARYTTKDPNLSDKILEFERRQPLNVNVVANAFEKYTGYTHREYTKDSLLQKYYELNTPTKFLKLMEQQTIKYSRITGDTEKCWYRKMNLYLKSDKVGGTDKGYYTTYSNVKQLSENKLVAIVSGYGTTPYLVVIPSVYTTYGQITLEGFKIGRWRLGSDADILRPMSYSADGLETYNATKIFWSEQVQDPRWGQVVKSKIFCYDLTDKSVSEVETEMPYLYKPTIHNDTLYAIQYKPMFRGSSIVAVKDLKNGKTISENNVLYISENQITDFQINNNALYLCTITNFTANCYIEKKERGNQQSEPLLKVNRHIIKNLDLKGDKLYFITDYFGKDVLCSLTDNKLIASDNGAAANEIGTVGSVGVVVTAKEPMYSMSEVKIESSLIDINSYDVSNYGDNIFLSKFDGERGSFVYKQAAQSIALNPDTLEFINPVAAELNRQLHEKLEPLRGKITPATNFQSTPYHKGSHLFHFHSWSPFFADVSGATSGSYDQIVNEGDIGLTAYSQNTLGTAITMLGYSYSFHNHKNAGHAKFTYTGWYPVIEASAHVGDKKVLGNKISFRSYLSAYIPLNYSRNGWQRGVTPQVYWQFKNYENVVDVVGETAEGKSIYRVHTRDRHMAVGTISAYSVFPIAKAQHFPRLGIGGRLYAGFSPKGGHYFGSITAAYIYAYLPGFTFNQGVRVSAAYQRQAVKTHFLDNFIAEPRGYTEDIYGKDYMKATIDYAIPIYLGDISLGPIAYLKSVNVVPFADLGLYRRNSVWRNRSSVGLDVTFRTHLFRIGYPLSIGFRYARTYRPGDIGSYSYSGYKAAGGGNGRKNYIGLLMEITFD